MKYFTADLSVCLGTIPFWSECEKDLLVAIDAVLLLSGEGIGVAMPLFSQQRGVTLVLLEKWSNGTRVINKLIALQSPVGWRLTIIYQLSRWADANEKVDPYEN